MECPALFARQLEAVFGYPFARRLACHHEAMMFCQHLRCQCRVAFSLIITHPTNAQSPVVHLSKKVTFLNCTGVTLSLCSYLQLHD
jgi:hypothetical protein